MSDLPSDIQSLPGDVPPPPVVPVFSAYKNNVVLESSGICIVHAVPKFNSGFLDSESENEEDCYFPHSLNRNVLNRAPLESLVHTNIHDYTVAQYGENLKDMQLCNANVILPHAIETRTRVVQLHVQTPTGEQITFTINRTLQNVSTEEVETQIRAILPQLYEYGNDVSGTYVVEADTEDELNSERSGEEQMDDDSSIDMSETSPDAVVCQHCSYSSPDPDICQRCRRPTGNTDNNSESFFHSSSTSSLKEVSSLKKHSSLRDNTPSKDSSGSDTSPSKYDKERRPKHHKKKRCTKKAKKQELIDAVAVVDLLSSDEDVPNVRNGSAKGTSKYPEPITNVFSKEPVITPDTEPSYTELNERTAMRGGGLEVENLLDSPDIERIKLDCRTVRFGSYKVVPTDKIILTEHGLKMKVPCLNKKDTSVIKILMKDIVKVLIHFGNSAQVSSGSAPAMFYYITHEASKRIRGALLMTNKSQEVYFDSTSKDELHKRITLLPETVSQTDRLFIKSIYESRCLMEELSWDEANDILVRAAPKEVQHTLKKEAPNVKNVSSTSNPNNDIQTIMVYPPPPNPGGLPINTEDYACLKEDQFLNDVIIDFYLKYLWLNVLSEVDKKRTHILSSFFYKRLTTLVADQRISQSEKLSPAEKRHARVKKWTKHVDIFEKDFIIIPINERSHWFLGIICYPGLAGPVRMSDGTPVPSDVKKKDTSVLAGGQAPAKIWGTTISIVKTGSEKASSSSRSGTISLVEGEDERGDESERDEAEADDDDIEPDTSDEESPKDEDLMDEATPRISKSKPNLEPIKQPCILIFDSLACASRSRVVATLREYLEVEWKVKNKGKPRDFSKNVFKGSVPKVPQQTNFIDCGVYVLQYVESFFKHPITDYRMPIRSIKEWFTTSEVNRKRYDIMQLLLSIMRDQEVDIERLNLPELDLHPYPHYEGDDEVLDDDGEYDEADLDDGEEEHLGEEEEEEEEEDENEHEHYQVIEDRLKSKRFEQRISNQRIEQLQQRIDMSSTPRIEPSGRLDRLDSSPRQSPRRFDCHSTRLDIKQEAVRAEPSRSTDPSPSRPRLPDSVTICEPNSKRKLPLSLKELRSPRIATPQTSIEKIKKPRVD